MTGALRHLRLVPPAPPPPRLEVRISAMDGRRAHYGRTRPFRLSERDLDELIAVASKMEARRA
jgi:hypothetical protein